MVLGRPRRITNNIGGGDMLVGEMVMSASGQWVRLSCRKFCDNEVRLQVHALAYNIANFMRPLALPKEVEHWSPATLRNRKILSLIDDTRQRPAPALAEEIDGYMKMTGELCSDDGKIGQMGF